MLNFDSSRFLLDKKLAQLVKLVNHLSTQISERRFQMDCITASFQSHFTNLISETAQALSTASFQLNSIGNSTDQFYVDQFRAITHELDSASATASANLTDCEITISTKLERIRGLISQIQGNIGRRIGEFVNCCDDQQLKLARRVSELSETHADEIEGIEADVGRRLENLETQRGTKLDALDRDFNRSLNDLKQKFGKGTGAAVTMSRAVVDCASLMRALGRLKEGVARERGKLGDMLRSFKMQRGIVREIRSDCERWKIEKEKDVGELEEIENGTEMMRLVEEAEEKERVRASEVDEMNRYLSGLRVQLIGSRAESAGYIKKAAESFGRDLADLDAESQIERSSVQLVLDRDRKRATAAIERLQAQIEGKRKVLLEAIHQQQEDVAKHHAEEQRLKSALAAEWSAQQKRYLDIQLSMRVHVDNTTSNDDLESKRTVRDHLETAYKVLAAKIAAADESIDEQLEEKYQGKIRRLSARYESELGRIESDDADLVNEARESYQRSLFRRNCELAEIHGRALEEVSIDAIPCDFTADWELELKLLVQQLESIEIPAIRPVSNNSLSMADLEARRLMVDKERNALVDTYLGLQKSEENRHLRSISAIQCLPLPPAPSVDRTHLVAFDLKIAHLRQILSELQSLQSDATEDTQIKEAAYREAGLRSQLEHLPKISASEIAERQSELEADRQRIATQLASMERAIGRSCAESEQESRQTEMGTSEAVRSTAIELEEARGEFMRKEQECRDSHRLEMIAMEKKHTSEVSALRESITELQDDFSSEAKTFTDRFNRAQAELNRALQVREDAVIEELEHDRVFEERNIGKLDEQQEDLMDGIEELRIHFDVQGSRITELDMISRLERTLELKTTHLSEITETFQECKRQIVTQEGVYNLRFGTFPNVAVLRPRTASGSRKAREPQIKSGRALSSSHSRTSVLPSVRGSPNSDCW